jgi:MFS transporter, DHA2 family, multidrug resistance protein
VAEGSGAAQGSWSPERSAAGNRNPWIIAAVLSISSFMEVLDTAIANVSLRHIAGGLSSAYDEATWVLTSYLVANAVVIPLSGWLADTFGRKRYYMSSVALFTIASGCCGIAPSLPFLIGARVVQGMAGGGLQPLTQAMLVDTFPPQKRGQALAIFGVTLILAPTIGPLLGGVITDSFSWRWIFLVNIPVGVVSLLLVKMLVDEPKKLREERKQTWSRGIRLDAMGLVLIAAGLGALEITMDRGEREDWFASPIIIASAIVAIVGLIAFVMWELTRRDPLLDLSIFKNRNFAMAMFVIVITGVIMYGTTQFIPQLLQEVLGYTATSAGMALTAGGVATLIAMPFAGILSDKIQPRYLIGGALIGEAFALWHMTHLSTEVTFWGAAMARVWQALPIPFLFIPLTNAAFVGVPGNRTNQASALLNVARNVGGSVGISLVQSLLANRQQFHQSRYVEQLNPLNPGYSEALDRITSTLLAQGRSAVESMQLAPALVYQTLLKQASMLAFIDCFWVLMIVTIAVFPAVMIMRNTPGIGGAKGKQSRAEAHAS